MNKFVFGIYTYTFDNDAGDDLLILLHLHLCGHGHLQLHISPVMDCNFMAGFWPFSPFIFIFINFLNSCTCIRIFHFLIIFYVCFRARK